MKNGFYVKSNILQTPGSDLIRNGFLKIEDGVVKEIQKEKGSTANNNWEVLNFEDSYLIPGLINTHCHLMFPGDDRDTSEVMASYPDSFFLLTAAENARKALKSGVTTLRDLGGTPEVVFKFREALNNGLFTGPRILTSGPALLPTGGHGWQSGAEVDTPDEIKKTVRRLIRDGSDIIKVMASSSGPVGSEAWKRSFRKEYLSLMAHEAHKRDVEITAHVTNPFAAEDCLEAGFDGLEHAGFWTDEDWTFEFMPEVAEQMEQTNVNVCLTIQASYGASMNAPTESERDRRSKMVDDKIRSLEKLKDYDINIVAGSDSGYRYTPFGALSTGLNLMTEAGLSEREALATATTDAARAMGLEDRIGSLKKRRKADFVVLEGNPTQDISELNQVKAVFKDGERVRKVR